MGIQWHTIKSIFLDTGLRIAVGTTFLVAAIGKLPVQEDWVETMFAYKILPVSLANSYAVAIPWLELVIGLCLITGLFIRTFSLLSIPVISSFVVANASALSMGANRECHCFGRFATMSYEKALIIDTLLLVGTFFIFFQRKRFFVLESWVAHFVPKLKC